jgi:hypothetical protein
LKKCKLEDYLVLRLLIKLYKLRQDGSHVQIHKWTDDAQKRIQEEIYIYIYMCVCAYICTMAIQWRKNI